MLVIDSITATYFKAAVNIVFLEEATSPEPNGIAFASTNVASHKPLLPLNVPKSIVDNKVCMCNFCILVKDCFAISHLDF